MIKRIEKWFRRQERVDESHQMLNNKVELRKAFKMGTQEEIYSWAIRNHKRLHRLEGLVR